MNASNVKMRPTQQEMFIRELPALKGKFLYPELEAIDREEEEIQRHPEIHEKLTPQLTADIEFCEKADAGALKVGGLAAVVGLCVVASFPVAGWLLLGGSIVSFVTMGSDENNENAYREVAIHRRNRLSNKIERIRAIEMMRGPVVGENQVKLAGDGLESLKNRCFFLSQSRQEFKGLSEDREPRREPGREPEYIPPAYTSLFGPVSDPGHEIAFEYEY
jgi:hypothetical protein